LEGAQTLKDSGIAAENNEYVEITCSDPSKFKAWSLRSLLANLRLVREASEKYAAGEMTKARFTNIEKSVGFRWNPLGLLADTELHQFCDPLSVITMDWVHNMFQDGIFTLEASGP
jgi:hypothetical protein